MATIVTSVVILIPNAYGRYQRQASIPEQYDLAVHNRPCAFTVSKLFGFSAEVCIDDILTGRRLYRDEDRLTQGFSIRDCPVAETRSEILLTLLTLQTRNIP
jgi:hypothetical protein